MILSYSRSKSWEQFILSGFIRNRRYNLDERLLQVSFQLRLELIEQNARVGVDGFVAHGLQVGISIEQIAQIELRMDQREVKADWARNDDVVFVGCEFQVHGE